jgi:hypothetical protein
VLSLSPRIGAGRFRAPSPKARTVGGGPISGLEWDGNETTNTQRVLRWLSPFAIYDATYIFRVYPKGPKNGGASHPNYWTAFFWGNYGTFNSSANYYGAHPYPFDGNDVSTGQNWEISLIADDFAEADIGANRDCGNGVWGAGGPPSETNNGAAATWNRWYTQVFRAFRIDANTLRNQFIWDWDLFVSSSGASGWFQKTVSSATWGTVGNNPTTPSIVVGEAPPNDANTASWGDYTGREQFKGIIRGIQMYDALVGTNAYVPTVANLADISSELSSPGSVRTPWYLNLNPTPSDVTDKSGSGHNPSFPASQPSLWTG